MKKSLIIVGILMMASASLAFADTPDPEAVHINSVYWQGTGCPAVPGSVVGHIEEDLEALKLTFADFYAEAGPGVPRSDTRKFCEVTVSLDVPAGFTYAIAEVSYRGFADLDSGATGIHRSFYYFTGLGFNSEYAIAQIYGPFYADYTITHEFDYEDFVYAPCGATRSLVINTSVAVRVPRRSSAGGLLTNDSMNMENRTVQRYRLWWQHC